LTSGIPATPNWQLNNPEVTLPPHLQWKPTQALPLATDRSRCLLTLSLDSCYTGLLAPPPPGRRPSVARPARPKLEAGTIVTAPVARRRPASAPQQPMLSD
jgi:hypothetical protein